MHQTKPVAPNTTTKILSALGWSACIIGRMRSTSSSGSVFASHRPLPELRSSLLDTTVTWTLTPHGNGTHLRMTHEGFVFPTNQAAYHAMKPGWGRVLDSVGRVTAEG